MYFDIWIENRKGSNCHHANFDASTQDEYNERMKEVYDECPFPKFASVDVETSGDDVDDDETQRWVDEFDEWYDTQLVK
jgi:hypothetical protein